MLFASAKIFDFGKRIDLTKPTVETKNSPSFHLETKFDKWKPFQQIEAAISGATNTNINY